MVNRIWQWHFGEGIVRTPRQFGRRANGPHIRSCSTTWPARSSERGWSVKSMHRMMMLSNTYQMSSLGSSESAGAGSGRRLLSRFPGRRLEVEEIRDSLLALDGSLDFTMGGALLSGRGTDKEFSDDRMSLNPDQSKRRTVYLPLRRSNLASVLTLFDFGDATTPGEGRSPNQRRSPGSLHDEQRIRRQAGAIVSRSNVRR